MNKRLLLRMHRTLAAGMVLFSLAPLLATKMATAAEAANGKLRIVVLGAHPDDAEICAGGAAALWAELGHKVELVSVTNGDIGHFAMSGGALAQRRTAEVQAASKILGTTSLVLDNHDGELLPTLENRKELTRVIRRWGADIVIGHRPNDYHPDHRCVGQLMQDCAFMVNVPFFCPDVPPLDNAPLFLYSYDEFQEPNPFRPDIVVAIDSVIEKKIAALLTLESQFIEGGALGKRSSAELAYLSKFEHNSMDPVELAKRRKGAEDMFRKHFAAIADRCRGKLIEIYGPEIGRQVRYAEAFQICEYGWDHGDETILGPNNEVLRQLFPFLPATRQQGK